MDNRSPRQGSFLDHVAIALSGLCLVHCLLLPAIIVALPLVGRLDESHFHTQMLLVVVPVSLFAFTHGYRRHGIKGIIAGGVAGIGLLLIGGTVAHANYGALADSLLTIAGSVILATSHYFNNRRMRHVPAS